MKEYIFCSTMILFISDYKSFELCHEYLEFNSTCFPIDVLCSIVDFSLQQISSYELKNLIELNLLLEL